MKILVACKTVPDDQDAQTTPDGELVFSNARQIVSEYDLNALEMAVRLAEANPGSSVGVLSVGSKKADDSKLKKSILAHGADELYLAADDALVDSDSRMTAFELSELVKLSGDYDLIAVGDGSADIYARQTGAQLADVLGVPYVPGAVELSSGSEGIYVKRVVENKTQELLVPCPCVISISSSSVVPRIPGMKDILGAGKKPMNVTSAAVDVCSTITTVDITAPQNPDRKRQLFEDIDEFAAAIKAAL